MLAYFDYSSRFFVYINNSQYVSSCHRTRTKYQQFLKIDSNDFYKTLQFLKILVIVNNKRYRAYNFQTHTHYMS